MAAPRIQSNIVAIFERLVASVAQACREHYGNRLVSLAVFGSVGRGTPRPDSDIDLLLVVERLPDGRMRRSDDFLPIEAAVQPAFRQAVEHGVIASLSPVFKTPAEADAGSPLLLDLIDDARLLVDRGDFMAGVLRRLHERLSRLGARRIWRGNAWFWDLKPDYKPGEEFEL